MALDVFVAPGTIESLPAAAAALAVIQRTKGPGPAGAAVAGALLRAVAGIPATVVPIKAEVLAAAAEGARHFDRFLAIFAGLGVISGLLLVALAVTILVDERRQELAILDALGVRRRDVAASMLVETAVYGATGVALGCAAGVAVSRLLVPLARGTFGGGVGLTVDLIWSVPATVAIDAFAIGVVGSLLAVTTAVALTRRRPAARRSPRAPWTAPLLIGAAGAAAGTAVLSAGFVRHPASALVVGDGTVLAGLIVIALVAVQSPVAQQLRSVVHRRSVAIWLGLATAAAIQARTVLGVASTTFAVFGIALAASVAGGYQSDQAHLSRALAEPAWSRYFRRRPPGAPRRCGRPSRSPRGRSHLIGPRHGRHRHRPHRHRPHRRNGPTGSRPPGRYHRLRRRLRWPWVTTPAAAVPGVPHRTTTPSRL